MKNFSSTPENNVSVCRERIALREHDIGAWQHLDWDVVKRQVAALETQPVDQRGPLWGIPVAIKDIFDTFDMPTRYGSSIYDGHQPRADAACISKLRAAGAIVLGKTVTTEFAFWQQGKTRNPHNLDHSPGGSSSGSAAAVADGMVPLALGSQTAASTIRPASYCGIVGFKPSIGRISLAGVKALSNAMDTVGAFGTCVKDTELLYKVLSGDNVTTSGSDDNNPPVAKVWQGPELESASVEMTELMALQLESLRTQGMTLETPDLPPAFAKLCEQQTKLMAFEASRELADEKRRHEDQLSHVLRDFLDMGASISAKEAISVLRLRDHCLQQIDVLFGEADVLILPSAPGVAPLYSDGTGDPVMSRAWTLLGLPSISIPLPNAKGALPLGMQLAARPGADHKLLTVAKWVESGLRQLP